ncbi:HNH endonuclease signature motif containing protein [Microbacterium panaciterrae]
MDFTTDDVEADGDFAAVSVGREQVDETFVAARLLDDLIQDDVAINRRAARRAVGVCTVLEHVRRHPEIYTVGDAADDADHSLRSAIFEVSLRLQVSEDEVRRLQCIAETAPEFLPLLWAQAWEGLAALRFVEAAVSAALRLRAPVGADRAEREYAAEAISLIDQASAEWAMSLSLPAFRRRLKLLVARLDPASQDSKHARGMADRRVVVEDADDGMSWVMALVPTITALAIKRRLTATAKHLQKDRREQRTRDQIRADLFGDWLCGVGTSSAVKTKVFVTIPAGLLAGAGTATAGTATLTGGAGNPVTSLTQAQLVGHGPIDPLTAQQLFLEATAFRRVITDPVRGVVLDMDRRTYRPTTAQRDWLILRHGTCARDGCTRLALDADLDHERAWARGGPTDVGNLRPLCPADHARNHRTRFHFRSREDRTVEVTSPTGFHTTDPPPF